MNIAHWVRRKTLRFGSSPNNDRACCRRFVHKLSPIKRIILVSRQTPSILF
jgi:hypothetical protein